MKPPWHRVTRSDEHWDDADRRVKLVRGHLRVLLNELEQTLARIEHQRRGMMSSDE